MAVKKKAAKKQPKRKAIPKKPAKKPINPDDLTQPIAKEPEETKPEPNNPKQTYEDLLAQITDKAARWVQEYLIDLNKQKAAERAGYSPRSCAQQVSVLLKNPKVLAALAEGKRLIAERAMINQDEVIKELARIGFSNIADYITVEGNKIAITDINALKRDQAAAILSIKETTTVAGGCTREFKLHDKVKALLGILDRVKPGADEPQKHEVAFTNFPPKPKSIAEWEAQVKEAAIATKKAVANG